MNIISAVDYDASEQCGRSKGGKAGGSKAGGRAAGGGGSKLAEKQYQKYEQMAGGPPAKLVAKQEAKAARRSGEAPARRIGQNAGPLDISQASARRSGGSRSVLRGVTSSAARSVFDAVNASRPKAVSSTRGKGFGKPAAAKGKKK